MGLSPMVLPLLTGLLHMSMTINKDVLSISEMIIAKFNIKYSVKILSQCYFVYHISHRNSLGMRPTSPHSRQPFEPATGHLVCKLSLRDIVV
jgi:hypothetical protein